MTTHEQSMETVGSNVLVLVVLVAAVLTTVGLLTCIVTHYQHHYHHHDRQLDTEQTTGCSPSSAHLIWNQTYCPQSNFKKLHKLNSTTVPMLALDASMERERCALRDRQVRLHSVTTDIGLDLPPSIHLPDGEEIPYGSSSRLHIRDPEQQSEIYRKCIKPPPNRTIEQSEPILPYRSSSTGLLSLSSSTISSSNSSNDWGQSVIRCHSMSSRIAATAAAANPPVILPTLSESSRSHRKQVSSGLAQITMVPCFTDQRSMSNHHHYHHHSVVHPSGTSAIVTCASITSSICGLSSGCTTTSSSSTTLTTPSRLTVASSVASSVTLTPPSIRQVTQV